MCKVNMASWELGKLDSFHHLWGCWASGGGFSGY